VSRTLRFLVLLAGTAVLIRLIRQTGVSTIRELLGRVGAAFIVVAVLYAGHVVCRARALFVCLSDRDSSFWDILRVRLTGEAIEILTFSGPILAEPAKGFLLKRRGLETSIAFGSIATEYLLYSFVSAGMAVTALSLLLAENRLPPVLHRPAIALITGMSLFIAGCVAAAITGVGLIVPAIHIGRLLIGQRRAAALLGVVEPIERVMVGFLHRRPARLAAVIGIEAVGQALLASEIWLVMSVLGVPRSFATALLAEGAAKFIGTVFAFVPGQIGASEASYILIFRALGLPDAIGLTVALVRRLRALLVAAVSLGVVAMTSDRRR